MNQTEFLSQLRQALSRHGLGDIDDILADFSEHFSSGMAMGKDERDIAAELGDPEEIAVQYAGEPARPLTHVDAAQPAGAAREQQPNVSGSGEPAASRPDAFTPPYGGREEAASGPVRSDRTTGGYIFVEDSRGNPRPVSGPSRPEAGVVAAGAVATGAAGAVAAGATGADSYVRPEAGTAATGARPVPSSSYSTTASGTAYTRTDTNATGGRQTVGQTAQGAGSHVPVEHSDEHVLITILLILLAIFVAVPVFFSILGILIGIWAAAFGVGAAAVALFVGALAQAGAMIAILVMFSLSLAALSILLFIGAYWLTRLFALGLRAYVRWNRRVANGGTVA